MTRPASAGVVVTLRRVLTDARDRAVNASHEAERAVERCHAALRQLDRIEQEQSAQAVEGPARCPKCDDKGFVMDADQCGIHPCDHGTQQAPKGSEVPCPVHTFSETSAVPGYWTCGCKKPEPKGSEGRDQTCAATADTPSASTSESGVGPVPSSSAVGDRLITSFVALAKLVMRHAVGEYGCEMVQAARECLAMVEQNRVDDGAGLRQAEGASERQPSRASLSSDHEKQPAPSSLSRPTEEKGSCSGSSSRSSSESSSDSSSPSGSTPLAARSAETPPPSGLAAAVEELRRLTCHYVDHFGRAEVRAVLSAWDEQESGREGGRQDGDSTMTDAEFRAFLDLMMCSDPWPITDTGRGDGREPLEQLAVRESVVRGYDGWIEAFHWFHPPQEAAKMEGGA